MINIYQLFLPWLKIVIVSVNNIKDAFNFKLLKLMMIGKYLSMRGAFVCQNHRNTDQPSINMWPIRILKGHDNYSSDIFKKSTCKIICSVCRVWSIWRHHVQKTLTYLHISHTGIIILSYLMIGGHHSRVDSFVLPVFKIT